MGKSGCSRQDVRHNIGRCIGASLTDRAVFSCPGSLSFRDSISEFLSFGASSSHSCGTIPRVGGGSMNRPRLTEPPLQVRWAFLIHWQVHALHQFPPPWIGMQAGEVGV